VSDGGRNTISVDLDRVAIDYLIERLERRVLTTEEARELKRRLEIEIIRALRRGDENLADKIAHTLIGLNGYIEGSLGLRNDIVIDGSLGFLIIVPFDNNMFSQFLLSIPKHFGKS
jgi:hypothetical protein